MSTQTQTVLNYQQKYSFMYYNENLLQYKGALGGPITTLESYATSRFQGELGTQRSSSPFRIKERMYHSCPAVSLLAMIFSNKPCQGENNLNKKFLTISSKGVDRCGGQG